MNNGEIALRLDRAITYGKLKFVDTVDDEYVFFDYMTDCESYYDQRIKVEYRQWINSRITSNTALGQARQALRASIEFCEIFYDYIWMMHDCSIDDAHYHQWRDYCYSELGYKPKNYVFFKPPYFERLIKNKIAYIPKTTVLEQMLKQIKKQKTNE